MLVDAWDLEVVVQDGIVAQDKPMELHKRRQVLCLPSRFRVVLFLSCVQPHSAFR
jgi:hypothetical protein